MKLGAIWRYPVKSMAGEQLQSADISLLGVGGDRVVQVFDRHGQLITSRSHPGLLAHRGAIGADGQPLVDGARWDATSVAESLRRVVGEGVSLQPDDGSIRFDVLPLLVATDGALKAFGRDLRRLRPNFVIDDVEGLAEREWPGRVLRIGTVEIGVHQVRQRCVMTAYDPDTQERDIEVLRDIRRRFGGGLGLDVEVLVPGQVRVGDPVELLP